MRGMGLGWLGGALLCLMVGCWTTDSHLKPPPRPEEYTLPPSDDPRFSKPPQYPRDTLNRDRIKKDGDDKGLDAMKRNQTRFGGGAGGPGGY